MAERVIEVKNVYKSFRTRVGREHTLKGRLINKNSKMEFPVLKGISFDVKKGEAVGLIGKNGCGKSTTLKLLTRIIYPDQGSVEVKGRVSSLLELGAGFHPDLSGYENIYLNASVFGLTRNEIDQRVEEIIRFSELGEFIDNPIKTYSSGMYMKLAFSVAINVDADILLIDEILGVGDVSFQKKCFEKLMDIKREGTTIVIVSHSTDQIERICDRSIWIEDGVIVKEGNPKEVHSEYLESMERRRLIRKIEESRERNTDSVNEFENTEQKKQEFYLKEAEKKRKESMQVHLDYLKKGFSEDDRTDEYYKKEKIRLELVVEEKNLEIERLNSVIREKDILYQNVLSELSQ